MLIRYFRLNDPYRLVGLLVILLLLYLPYFINTPAITLPELKSILIGERLNEDKAMYTNLVDNTAPFAAWSYEMIESLFGRSLLARHILGFILLFLQAGFLAIMFIARKVSNENTYVPAFIFSLLVFFSFDTVALTGELIGVIFLLLALNNLFKELEFRVQYDETIFNLGLFISIASLFSFAFAIYILWVMIVLVFFTRSTPRKFLLLIFGFLLPHLLVITIAYLNDSLSKMWQYYYLGNLTFKHDALITAKSLLILSFIPLMFLVISVVMLQREARFSKYQSQVLQIMFLWIGFSLVYIFYARDLRPQTLIVFAPALALVLTHFFLVIRRRKFLEFNTWVFFLGIVSVSYLSRFQRIESVNYSNMLVNGKAVPINDKRIVVLDNDASWYLHNRLGMPYLNWSLSEDSFANADTYENVTEVYHHLKEDAPDAIVDPNNFMGAFFNRFPQERNAFIKKGNVYVRASN